jgi:hypothetical protein
MAWRWIAADGAPAGPSSARRLAAHHGVGDLVGVAFVASPTAPTPPASAHRALLHHVRRLVCRRVQVGRAPERDVVASGECGRAHAAGSRGGPVVGVRLDAGDVVAPERQLDLVEERQRTAAPRGSLRRQRVHRLGPRRVAPAALHRHRQQLIDEGRVAERRVDVLRGRRRAGGRRHVGRLALQSIGEASLPGRAPGRAGGVVRTVELAFEAVGHGAMLQQRPRQPRWLAQVPVTARDVVA